MGPDFARAVPRMGEECEPIVLLQEGLQDDGWEEESIICRTTEFSAGLIFISHHLWLTLICDCGDFDEPAYQLASFLTYNKVGQKSSVGVVISHTEAGAIDAWIQTWHRSMSLGDYIEKMFGHSDG